MSVEIITSFERQSNASDTSMSGGKIFVYDVGTTTLRAIFAASDLSGSQAANPIICDSAGRHDMRYTATGSYKIVVKTSADVTVYTRDNIDGRVPIGSGALAIANGGTGATTAGAALTNLGAASSADLTAQAAEIAALSGTLNSVERTHVATGTTAQRPDSPIEGDIRRNTTTSLYEGYTGSAWVNFATSGLTTFHPTYQVFTSGTGATYTRPAGAKWLRIRAVGGGGGGGGTSGGTSPTAGGTTSVIVGGTTYQAIGGSPGTNQAVSGTGQAGGVGGTGGTGTATDRQNGDAGAGGTSVAGTDGGTGGNGGGSRFGGGGGINSGAATTNSGGGGGGSQGAVAGRGGSGGGGGGEYFELIVPAPLAATYTYSVGAAGTTGSGAGAASAGKIIFEEYYA